jgi:hypothetical protein
MCSSEGPTYRVQCVSAPKGNASDRALSRARPSATGATGAVPGLDVLFHFGVCFLW